MKLSLILMFIMHVYFTKHCSSFDYCTIKCGKDKHTMCEYPAGGGETCTKFKHGLKLNEKQALLDKHNKLRQEVANGKTSGQPAASDMVKLEWDEELEEIAQRWAEQCTHYLSHDKCSITKTGENTGQNLAIKSASSMFPLLPHAEKMVERWYSEVRDFARTNVKSFVPEHVMKIGHYSQLAWSTTAKVGCGANMGTESPYILVLVCNYKPAGNWMGGTMYREGSACSNCPANTTCSKKYPGLCAHFINGVESTACSNCPANTTCSKKYPGLCAHFVNGVESDGVSSTDSLTPNIDFYILNFIYVLIFIYLK